MMVFSRRVRLSMVSALVVLGVLVLALFELHQTRVVPFTRLRDAPKSSSNTSKPASQAPIHDSSSSSKWGSQRGSDRLASASDSLQATERLAYATFLSSTVTDKDNPDYNDDVYFVAIRLLVYQLLHAPMTRTNRSIPVIVLTTPDVSQDRRDRLTKDGATLIPVDYLNNGSGWMIPGRIRWSATMAKLRLWELTEYSRIFFMDADVMLRRPLDGIFDDPAAQFRPTLTNVSRRPDETPLPPKYLFAAMGEAQDEKHHWPPWPEELANKGDLNSGFFLLSPSKKMFDHYVSLAEITDLFNSQKMEQGLLNYAHRPESSIPWQSLNFKWNVRHPTKEDIDGDVASIHDKWWQTPEGYPELVDWFVGLRWRMEGFYEAYDERHVEL